MAQATANASGTKIFEDVFQNIRKAAEANMKLQQEMFQQWTSLWPMQAPQAAWIDKIRDFQKQWSHTVSEVAKKHREVLDKQYQAAIDSLDAGLRVAESSSPEEYRRRSEDFCRKVLDCMRDVSETQVKEIQDAISKWTDLATKAGK